MRGRGRWGRVGIVRMLERGEVDGWYVGKFGLRDVVLEGG